MTQSQRLWKAAAWIAGIPVLCSLIAYGMLDPDPAATYGMIPGMRVGRFLCAIISIGTTSDKHAVNMMLAVIIASIVDFLCYFAVIYVVLSLSFIGSRKVKVRY